MKKTPINKALYNRVVSEAKKQFKAWPSAYASIWVQREYKRRGGKFKGFSAAKSGLSRWLDEKWVDACQYPKLVPCGRGKKDSLSYPYCRPSVRVSPKTPKTVHELTMAQISSMCTIKKKTPSRRMKSV